MKKVFLFFTLALLFAGCDVSNDEPQYQFDLVPVSSVDMPTAFAKDSITLIPVKYIKPTTCHFFDSFYYEKNGFTRTVGITCAQLIDTNCQIDNATEIEVNLPFKPGQLGTYHFKFYIGEDINNLAQFIEYDVLVDH